MNATARRQDQIVRQILRFSRAAGPLGALLSATSHDDSVTTRECYTHRFFFGFF